MAPVACGFAGFTRTMHLHLSVTPRLQAGSDAACELALLDAALLSWLALEGPTSRARLAQLLWPDKDAEAARNSLRQRLFQLRKQTGVELVRGSTTLALADGVTHDLVEADSVLGATAADDIAPGEFAQWLEQQRMRRRDRVRRSLVELAEMAEAAKDIDDALAHARELLALEPLSEDAHRRVMRLHYLAGDRAAALLAFDRCERVLKDEVGAKPSRETLALLATIESSQPGAGADGARPVPASVLRPPRLVGRDRELAQLEQGWQAHEVVALIGEAGMGKTRLLQDFAATRPGVVHAAGRPGDAGVPFATLARLLRAVMAREAAGAVALAAAPARAELARVLPELDPALPRPAGEGQRLVLQRALVDLLQARPGLHGLIVDDLHFADEASLEMLAALVDQSGESPHWALAYRPAETGSPARALHDGLVEQARLVPVVLAPLDAAQLAELIDSLALPGVSGSALAEGLLKRTGGNPLFVLETLKQAWVDRTLAELADAQRLPRPVAVGRLIERRVAQLSPGALALARAAAIAGVDFDIALAEHVLGASALQFADALNELEAAQVMRGPQFAHDLVFDAVHASVPQAIARHLHARIAGWLEQHGGEPARVARHWVDAGQPTQALPWLAKAAAAARAALRPKEHVAFMEAKSAIEAAAGDPAAAFESLYEAAQELRSTDSEFQRGLAQCQQLDALAVTPVQRVKALLERGLLHAWVRDSRAAHEVLQRALAELERSAVHDEALTASVHQGLGVACQQAGRTHDALAHMRAALAWFDHHAGVHERAQAHGDLATVLDNLGRPDEALTHHRIALQQMRAAGDVNNLSIACGNLACNRIDAGDLAAADAALEQAQQIIASHDGFEGELPLLRLLHTLVLSHLGRYGEALLRGEQCIAATQRSVPSQLLRARLRLAQCWWHLGQWARLAQALGEAVPAEDADILAVCMHARLRLAYARAHPKAAADGAVAALALRTMLERLTAESERPDMCHALRIELAVDLPPADALRELSAVALDARRIGHLGTARAAHVRAAAAAATVDAEQARREASCALALADDARCDTVTQPAELWLHAGRALVAAGDARAPEVLERGRRWVLDTAATQVPEPYRDSFLHRNPVNRELLALAARLTPR
jgi:DNA-binding SARP family transcriptional activator